MSLFVVVTADFFDPVDGFFRRGELIDTTVVVLPDGVLTIPYGPDTKEVLAAVAVIKSAQSGRTMPQSIVDSGTYPPIASALKNISVLVFDLVFWQRSGASVMIQGCARIQSSGGAKGSFEMSLPGGAVFDFKDEATGLLVTGSGVVGLVSAVPLAARVLVEVLEAAGTPETTWQFSFGYKVMD